MHTSKKRTRQFFHISFFLSSFVMFWSGRSSYYWLQETSSPGWDPIDQFHTGMLRPKSGPLTLSHTKFGGIWTLSHTKFRKLAPFHSFPWKGTYPFHISLITSSLKKGSLSHTWSPKRYPFLTKHPRVVHHREYRPLHGLLSPSSLCQTVFICLMYGLFIITNQTASVILLASRSFQPCSYSEYYTFVYDQAILVYWNISDWTLKIAVGVYSRQLTFL